MAQTEIMSIPVPTELMSTLKTYADQSQTNVEAVAQQALRSFVQFNPEQNALREQHLQRAAALGLETEDYVARMIKEWRREDREMEERDAAARS